MLISILITVVAGYFIGAIPVGYLVARARGVNILEHGSKNPGATNVMRVLGEKFGSAGKKLGYLVFALDVVKGAVATGWPILAAKLGLLCTLGAPSPDAETLALIGLAASLLGNGYSCFMGFKGGKGVSTGAGGFLVLMPVSIVIALLLWWALFEITRYVSLASMIATGSLSVTSLGMNLLWAKHEVWWIPSLVVVGISALAAVFVAWRHRSNITRLLNGTENKFVRKSRVGAA
jgi:glycerol-3-phosphate acyltransferase PlsY